MSSSKPPDAEGRKKVSKQSNGLAVPSVVAQAAQAKIPATQSQGGSLEQSFVNQPARTVQTSNSHTTEEIAGTTRAAVKEHSSPNAKLSESDVREVSPTSQHASAGRGHPALVVQNAKSSGQRHRQHNAPQRSHRWCKWCKFKHPPDVDCENVCYRWNGAIDERADRKRLVRKRHRGDRVRCLCILIILTKVLPLLRRVRTAWQTSFGLRSHLCADHNGGERRSLSSRLRMRRIIVWLIWIIGMVLSLLILSTALFSMRIRMTNQWHGTLRTPSRPRSITANRTTIRPSKHRQNQSMDYGAARLVDMYEALHRRHYYQYNGQTPCLTLVKWTTASADYS